MGVCDIVTEHLVVMVQYLWYSGIGWPKILPSLFNPWQLWYNGTQTIIVVPRYHWY